MNNRHRKKDNMNKEQITAKLQKYEQMQLLRFFDELTEEEQQGLLFLFKHHVQIQQRRRGQNKPHCRG